MYICQYISIYIYIHIYSWNESHALDHSGCAPRCGFRRELPTSSPWSLPQPSLLPGYRSMPHVTWGPNSSSLIFQCTSPVSGHPHSVFHRKLGIEVGYPQFLAILPTWSSMTSSTGQVGPPIEIPGISAELRSPTNPPGCSTHLLHQPDGWRMASPKGTKTRGRQPISVVSTWLCYVNLIAFILHIYIKSIYIYNYI